MPNTYDLIGQKFGRLTVIEKTTKRKNGNVVWKCLCDCGNETEVITHSLVKGFTKSCGCLHKEDIGKRTFKDITGQKFGRLTALYPTSKSQTNGQYYWFCQCECGEHTIVRGDSLRNGSIQSCGCLQKERNSINLTNQTIGFLRFIEPTTQRKYSYIVWKCQCLKCGNECYISTADIARGRRACGCISKSIGEQRIIDLLQSYNIKYIREYTNHNCRYKETNALARFDFYLPELNYIIEYDGRQHFIEGDSVYDNPHKFAETQSHDYQKNQWCLQNHIPLIRIPYWHFDDLVIDDLLLEKSKFIM